jgi:ankyrin repeat protein
LGRHISSNIELLDVAAAGSAAVARALLRAGAAPNRRCDARGGSTPLGLASAAGHLQCVQELLAADAAPDRADAKGWTPLALAVAAGAAAAASFLAAVVTEIYLCNPCSCQTLRRNIETQRPRPGHLGVAQLLISHGADVEQPLGAERQTALMVAVQARGSGSASSLRAVHALLAARADVLAAERSGRTALHHAAVRGHVGLVALLLEAGAIVDAPDAAGVGPLSLAAEAGHGAICAQLHRKSMGQRGAVLDRRVAVDQGDSAHGRTPLMAAAERGHGAAVTRLLNARCAVDLMDRERAFSVIRTPSPPFFGGDRSFPYVTQACGPGHGFELGHALAGDGRTALRRATAARELQTVRLLLEAGASVDLAGPHCRPPLHLACWQGAGALVEQLLRAGADDTLKVDGLSPMDCAHAGGQPALAQLLTRHHEVRAQQFLSPRSRFSLRARLAAFPRRPPAAPTQCGLPFLTTHAASCVFTLQRKTAELQFSAKIYHDPASLRAALAGQEAHEERAEGWVRWGDQQHDEQRGASLEQLATEWDGVPANTGEAAAAEDTCACPTVAVVGWLSYPGEATSSAFALRLLSFFRPLRAVVLRHTLIHTMHSSVSKTAATLNEQNAPPN